MSRSSPAVQPGVADPLDEDELVTGGSGVTTGDVEDELKPVVSDRLGADEDELDGADEDELDGAEVNDGWLSTPAPGWISCFWAICRTGLSAR